MQIFKRVGLTALKLLLIPGLVEAFFDGALAVPIFGMSWTFGMATGFILKAVGPALVIQLMFETASKRLGTAKGASQRPLQRHMLAPIEQQLPPAISTPGDRVVQNIRMQQPLMIGMWDMMAQTNIVRLFTSRE